MRSYHQLIAEATGISEAAVLDEIEDLMREVIFHSTLDWQTREELIAAAMEANTLRLAVSAQRKALH